MPKSASACIPVEFARRWNIAPLGFRDGTLELGMANPLDLDALDAVAHLHAGPIEWKRVSPEQIRMAIDRCYGLASESPLPQPTATAENAATEANNDHAIISAVEAILHEAIRRRASDIHFEPLAKRFRVRYRVDGSLVEVESPPNAWTLPVISRLKIMAQMNIAEKRLPQDGRIQVTFDARTVDLRAASMPTVHGESVVLRILEPPQGTTTLDDLGLCAEQRATLNNLLSFPDGMLLITGPTGCGKSTTLYSCLEHLNEAARKVITVEDPIERQIRGITQVPVRDEIGMTFASALRAMLRQAPNVIMVGEIRDCETAEIALNAALTGHLVLSTLHTNDAPSAVTRLVDLGAKPFLVAAALRGVIAQRLVRRNCVCGSAELWPATNVQSRPGTHGDTASAPAALAGLPSILHRELVQRQAEARERRAASTTGCPACLGIGFHGRLPIFEMFLISDAARKLVHQGATSTRMRALARAEGMRSLREDGIRKVLAGLTTIDEVLSATFGESEQPQPTSMS